MYKLRSLVFVNKMGFACGFTEGDLRPGQKGSPVGRIQIFAHGIIFPGIKCGQVDILQSQTEAAAATSLTCQAVNL